MYVDAVIVYWKARETEEKTVVKKQREIDTGKYKEICVCVCERERETRRDETEEGGRKQSCGGRGGRRRRRREGSMSIVE